MQIKREDIGPQVEWAVNLVIADDHSRVCVGICGLTYFIILEGCDNLARQRDHCFVGTEMAALKVIVKFNYSGICNIYQYFVGR